MVGINYTSYYVSYYLLFFLSPWRIKSSGLSPIANKGIGVLANCVLRVNTHCEPITLITQAVNCTQLYRIDVVLEYRYIRIYGLIS